MERLWEGELVVESADGNSALCRRSISKGLNE